MDSSSARVCFDTGSIWFLPKLAGRLGSACGWCLETAGRGLGSSIRDLDVVGCLVVAGGGVDDDEEDEEGVGSVVNERMATERSSGCRRRTGESMIKDGGLVDCQWFVKVVVVKSQPLLASIR